jgi:hypothetical protein
VIGELAQTLPRQRYLIQFSPQIVEYSAECIVLGCVSLVRSVAGSRSATVYFETINTADDVIDKKLFAVRVAPEWNGELFYLADRYSPNDAGSPFTHVCETIQQSAGPTQQINDSYPATDVTGHYHYRGIAALVKRAAFTFPAFTQGVHTIRSPKVAIFRNPLPQTKRWFVRHRDLYFQNDPANPLLLAPSGDNVVTAAEARGSFTEGTVYTGDEHPEISLTGPRRLPGSHAERTAIEPFYYLADLRGGKRIKVTYREIEEGTGDPIMSNEYPLDGTARSDQTIVSSSMSGVQFNGSQCTFIPLG